MKEDFAAQTAASGTAEHLAQIYDRGSPGVLWQ